MQEDQPQANDSAGVATMAIGQPATAIGPVAPGEIFTETLSSPAQETSMLSDSELELAFLSALALLDAPGFSVSVSFHEYASLKSTVHADYSTKKITAKVSDGFRAGTREALTGLALMLMHRLLRRRMRLDFDPYVKAYKEEFNKEAAYALSDSLRRTRGRKRKVDGGQGKHVLLESVIERVIASHPKLFAPLPKPSIHWSKTKSYRRLAFYDSAFNSVIISKRFDSQEIPDYVLDYLVYHELLHARHGQQFKNLRRRVHTRAFKREEKAFPRYHEAEEYLKGR